MGPREAQAMHPKAGLWNIAEFETAAMCSWIIGADEGASLEWTRGDVASDDNASGILQILLGIDGGLNDALVSAKGYEPVLASARNRAQ